MRLISLRLKGFKGLRAGIGVDEVFIDFSQLPEGLIAIVGPNGSGKTTILDNCHPYRIMPYKCRKAKDWTPGAFSFYDQCFGSDAMKELVFSMAGTTYKSLVLIDVPRRKQEAYLYRDDGAAGWIPLNDGKTKTYDEAVERVVGSPSLFFTSVFRSQGAKNLSDYSRGDIMGIISELLNVDHIREQSEKARKVADALKSVVVSEQNKLGLLHEDLQRAGDLSSQVSALDAETATLRAQRATVASGLEEMDADLLNIQKCQAAQASERARLDDLRRNLDSERKAQADLEAETASEVDRMVKDKNRALCRLDDDLSALQRRISALDIRKQERTESYAKSRDGLLAKIARAEKIVSGAADIREKVAVETRISSELASVRKMLAEMEDHRQGLNGIVAGLAMQESKLVQSLAHAQKDADKLTGLDCRGDGTGWLNPVCRFISDAVASRDAIPTIETDLGLVRSELAQKRSELQSCQDVILETKEGIADLESHLAELSRWTRLLPELELAETNLEHWRSDLAGMDAELAADLDRMHGEGEELRARLAERKAERETISQEHADRIASLRASSDKRMEAIRSRIVELEESIAGFPVFEDMGTALAELEQRVAECRILLSKLDEDIRVREIKIGTLRGQLLALDSKRAEAAEIEGKVERYNAEIAHWMLLAKACSNDGIIALELDDAAPSIASIVNELLLACYGPRFTVRLDTQTAKANGDMKEAFDIVIYDGETDEEKSITECSGGQTNWLEDAITRGICLFNIHRSDREFGTLFADERDGMLDPEKKLEFLAIKRQALEMGTHERELFITQTPELWEQADGLIVLGRGGVTVQ